MHTNYDKHASFAYAYNQQQMLDREAGKLELAIWCQQKAKHHYELACQYREEQIAYLKGNKL